jgi:hypothetical protein
VIESVGLRERPFHGFQLAMHVSDQQAFRFGSYPDSVRIVTVLRIGISFSGAPCITRLIRSNQRWQPAPGFNYC